MYLDHFGLSALPFAEAAWPVLQVAVPSREAAARRLRYGLECGAGPVLLVGPPGSGKTRVAAALCEGAGGLVVHLHAPSLRAPELPHLVAEELGGPAGGTSTRWLRERLAAGAAAGARPVLMVDEAQMIADAATFEALRALQNFASGGRPDLDLVLVGAPEVLLRVPASLTDRLAARVALQALDLKESGLYLAGRLVAAGAREPLFDAESVALLHEGAAGLPRRLNRLADLALLIAFGEDRPRPDPRCAHLAVRELYPESLAA